MNRFFKILAIVLIVLFCAGVLFAQSGPASKPGWPAYAFSILLGFGTGQFYLGENGVGFLVGDLALYAGIAGYYVNLLTLPYGDYSALQTRIFVGSAILGIGSVITLVSRVWEIIDVIGSVDRLTKEGKVASLTPTLEIRPTGVCFGLSCRL